MNDKKKKKPYARTNYTQILNLPDEVFPSPAFDDFMSRATYWELRDEYVMLSRVYNRKTGKVKEVTYKQSAAAERFVFNTLTNQNAKDVQVLTATHDEISLFTPNLGDDS